MAQSLTNYYTCIVREHFYPLNGGPEGLILTK